MATAEKDPKTPKAPKEKAEGYAWVVVDDAGSVLALERSETRALWIAVAAKANVVKWPFGKTRDDVLGGAS